ncbi:DUF1102 domain-containing protein [Geoglobus acetivorans]|uniref:VWFA domain-containing protein n=1 Tax=Geoglobus acetivorans TaxID=565033 RepID=A0A0A7GHW7_GEOAI|nr:hypothetical protein GACE_1515 [Geoglobus acetivorans]
MPQSNPKKIWTFAGLLVTLLIASAYVIGITATFTEYTAKRNYSIAVVSDDQELIDLKPLQPYAYIGQDGKLYIDFSTNNPKWNEGKGEGLSPDSKYAFDRVFEISNDLWDGVCINVTVTSEPEEIKTYIENYLNASQKTVLQILPGERKEVGLLIESEELGSIDGRLRIHAEPCNGAVPTPTPSPSPTPEETPTPTPTPVPQNFEWRVELPERAPKGDIVFMFDVTGSMLEELNQAKVSAIDLMTDIRLLIQDSRFGVASLADYPKLYLYSENYGYGWPYGKNYGAPGDYPWRMDSDLTYDINAAAGAINNLEIKNGLDEPEPYAYAVHKAMSEMSWRDDARKILVILGDAPPHNMPNGLSVFENNYGGDPGDDWLMNTSDDVDYVNAINSADAFGLTIISIYAGRDDEFSNDARTNFMYMADMTDGAYAELQGDLSALPTIIENKIKEVAEQPIGNLTLRASAPPGWTVTWTPDKYTNVAWGSQVTFSIQITPPEPHTPQTVTIELLADDIVIDTIDILVS